MKRFTVPTKFGDVNAPFHVYIGEPVSHLHPLHFQTVWVREERGGEVPHDVLESFEKLYRIAAENRVSFEDLCVYALGNKEERSETAQREEGRDTLQPECNPTQQAGGESERPPTGSPGRASQATPALTIDEALLDEKVEILVVSADGKKTGAYALLRLSLRRLYNLKQAINRGEVPILSDFGQVLVSGNGEPSVAMRSVAASAPAVAAEGHAVQSELNTLFKL